MYNDPFKVISLSRPNVTREIPKRETKSVHKNNIKKCLCK